MAKRNQASRTDEQSLISAWHFPDLESPSLSTQLLPGQHEALMLLDDSSIAEIFDPRQRDGRAPRKRRAKKGDA